LSQKYTKSKGRREKEKEKGSPGISMYSKRTSLMHGQKVNNPPAISYVNAIIECVIPPAT